MSRLLCLVLVFAPAIFAIKSSSTLQKQEELLSAVPPTPPGPLAKCKYNTSNECMADECCNWCGLYFNATVGFCLPLVPVPIPALVCERVPATCKTLLTPTDCALEGDCKWVPMGPPGTLKGMCIYDWDKCKVPSSADSSVVKALPKSPSLAKAVAAKKEAQEKKEREVAPPPVPPKPKGVCNITTESACDAHKCCQWCGTAFNATAPGFCMPILDFPLPTITCSKGGAVCADATTEPDCDGRGVCTWHPFGPPGAKGPGMCTFDVYKCV